MYPPYKTSYPLYHIPDITTHHIISYHRVLVYRFLPLHEDVPPVQHIISLISYPLYHITSHHIISQGSCVPIPPPPRGCTPRRASTNRHGGSCVPILPFLNPMNPMPPPAEQVSPPSPGHPGPLLILVLFC